MYKRRNPKSVYYISDIYDIIYVCFYARNRRNNLKKYTIDYNDRLCLKMKNEI